jgi:transcriptional regulator with XRE-family HTH domain
LEINAVKRGKRRGKRQIGVNALFYSNILLDQARFAYYILAIALNFCDDVFQWRSAVASWLRRPRSPNWRTDAICCKRRPGPFEAAPGDLSLLDVSKAAGVGGNIRQMRIAKGLTLDRLASLSELTRGYISLVERGLKMPSIAALLRLATALEVNVTYFFDPHSEPAARYTLFRQEDRSVTKDAGFELIALAAGRTGKMMEPVVMSPPLTSAFRASHAGE